MQCMKLRVGLCCFIFLFFLWILFVAYLEVFLKWSQHPSLFFFFTLTHWSKTWKICMQNIKPKEANNKSKRQQVKGREIDISWSTSPCTHGQRSVLHMHIEGLQLWMQWEISFSILTKWNGYTEREKERAGHERKVQSHSFSSCGQCVIPWL